MRRAPDSLATFLIDLSPGDMKRRLGDALGIYVDAMRYPRGTEDQRASMWLEHTGRVGWTAVAAVDAPPGSDESVVLTTAPMLGVAYGYCGAPDQWWQQQVIQGLERVGRRQPLRFGHRSPPLASAASRDTTAPGRREPRFRR